jgi:hypothetical protein
LTAVDRAVVAHMDDLKPVGRAWLSELGRLRVQRRHRSTSARAVPDLGAGDRSGDPRAAAPAAWPAADFLAAAARVVEGRRGGPLTAASGEYERAASELWAASRNCRRPARDCAPRRSC